MITNDDRDSVLAWIVDAIDKDIVALPLEAGELTPGDWAQVLESSPPHRRLQIWELLEDAERGAILAAMREDPRNQLLDTIELPEIVAIARDSTAEQVVEILDVVSEDTVESILRRLSPENRVNVNNALAYDEDQLGRYINSEALTVDADISAAKLLLALKTEDIPEYTDTVLVIDRNNQYLGLVDLNVLLGSPHDARVGELAHSPEMTLSATQSLLDASDQVRNSGRSMLPVLDEGGELLGRFSLHDALEVFQEHFEEQIMRLNRTPDEDLFAPTLLSARRRAVWLGINLATAFMASFVIGLFEEVVAQVVALAVLLPIVASMGGITGSQTLTLTIRGLATGHLSRSNISALGGKELSVALLNGLLWGVAVAILAGLWFQSPLLSCIVAGATVVNMLVAAAAGIAIPVALEKAGIDPALAGSVILTTITDVVGFFVFLGSASLLLV